MEKQRIDEMIRALRNLDVNDVNVHEKAKNLLLSVGQVHIAIGTLPANNVLCRTRTHFDNVLFTDVEEIGTPKSGHVKRYGRCNKPNSPIFYCSDERITSYSELAYDWLRDCPDGATVYATISTWKTIKDTSVLVIASPDVEKRITEFDKLFGGRLDEVIAGLDTKNREGTIAYHRFLNETFSSQGKANALTYIITSAYSELALEIEARLDGIVYPCVPRLGAGLNYALRPEYIKPANIELQMVSRDKIKRRDIPGDLPELKEVEIIDAFPYYANSEINWCSYAMKKFDV